MKNLNVNDNLLFNILAIESRIDMFKKQNYVLDQYVNAIELRGNNRVKKIKVYDLFNKAL